MTGVGLTMALGIGPTGLGRALSMAKLRSPVLAFNSQSKNPRELLASNDFPLEPPRGFEPRTYALQARPAGFR